MITVLNSRVSILADEKKIPDAVQETFENFLEVHEEHWGEAAEADHTSPLGRAYHRFLQAVQEHRAKSAPATTPGTSRT